MDISFIFKMAAMGIVIGILNQVLAKAGKEEQAFLVTLSGVVFVLMLIIPEINRLFETIVDLFGL